MPHWAAASPRGRPSSTSAIASIRRAAFASRVRAAFRRRSAADRSVRVIATAIPASRIHVREKRIIPTSARGITGESTIRALGISHGWALSDGVYDYLHETENAVGSEHNDVLVGDGLSNMLVGRGGGDVIVGGYGHDT